MYVCPMPPLYAGSQPAPTRPSATPTEAPKPSRETAPCIPPPSLQNPTIGQQLHGADSWARRNVRKLLPLPVIIGLQPHIEARLGLRPSKAVTGASVRVHKSRLVSSPCFPCSFSNPVHCRSTARAPPAAQPSNALPPPLPAPSPALPQSLVLPRNPCCHQSITNHCWKRQFSERRKISEKTVKAPPSPPRKL